METAVLAPYVGEIAGVGTSLLWTVTTLFFTAAGRRVGATVVNATRITFACLLLAITHRCLQGAWVPDAPATQVVYLAASGVLGLTIGDQAIITAFVEIGPRLALLVTTTAPLWAALFGYMFLGERLAASAWLGLVLTVGGIVWVLGERRDGRVAIARSKLVRGVILALVSALCQSGGYLLSKLGMGHGEDGRHLDAQSATLLRMTFAAATILPVLAMKSWFHHGRVSATPSDTPRGAVRTTTAQRESRAAAFRLGILFSLCGAVTGPYLGVWLSLIACDRAPLGVAQTLLTLAPVFILPATAWLNRERVTARAALGALAAVAGAAVLFLAKATPAPVNS